MDLTLLRFDGFYWWSRITRLARLVSSGLWSLIKYVNEERWRCARAMRVLVTSAMLIPHVGRRGRLALHGNLHPKPSLNAPASLLTLIRKAVFLLEIVYIYIGPTPKARTRQKELLTGINEAVAVPQADLAGIKTGSSVRKVASWDGKEYKMSNANYSYLEIRTPLLYYRFWSLGPVCFNIAGYCILMYTCIRSEIP